MQRETQPTHAGPWRQLVNLSAHRIGSAHDDEQARKMGFRGAIVPGSTVAEAAVPGILALLGEDWMKGGWYSFKFVGPVYSDEEVREVAQTEGDEIALKVVTRDGRVCCAGRAGLGFRPAWAPEEDGKRGAESVFPRVEIGESLGSLEFRVSPDEIRPMLDSAGDDTPWYEASSPWGGGIVPPEWLHRVARVISRTAADKPILPFTGIREPGMWSQHDLMLSEPLFLGRPYVMREWVADKGVSGRTVFVTYQFEVTVDGSPVAIGRHSSKWFPAE